MDKHIEKNMKKITTPKNPQWEGTCFGNHDDQEYSVCHKCKIATPCKIKTKNKSKTC